MIIKQKYCTNTSTSARFGSKMSQISNSWISIKFRESWFPDGFQLVRFISAKRMTLIAFRFFLHWFWSFNWTWPVWGDETSLQVLRSISWDTVSEECRLFVLGNTSHEAGRASMEGSTKRRRRWVPILREARRDVAIREGTAHLSQVLEPSAWVLPLKRQGQRIPVKRTTTLHLSALSGSTSPCHRIMHY